MRILNVAEKNDAAKLISNIMSRNHCNRREGLSKFNKIYEFQYHVFGQQCQMVMTSVSGHLMNYDFPSQYRNWQGCDPLVLFSAPVVKQCKMVDIEKTLKREIRNCQKLIIWTDGDREGENIGFEIINVCLGVKRDIGVYRARFSEITQRAIQRAVNNLETPDAKTNDAVEVRQELDLRIGAAFTRFQTLRLRHAFPNFLADQLVSYGSCQFPTLGFVVERYKEIENFIHEPFWKLRVFHKKDDKEVEFLWKRQRLFDELMCTILHEFCLENPIARVTQVWSKPKSKWRPCALDTVELEKLASRKLRIGAKETMSIAERLYTQGFISYPRTETNIFPKDLNLRPLVEAQCQDGRWGDFASRLLEAGLWPRNGKKSDQAHPPIHPLKAATNLDDRPARIYELITRHFLACLSSDAKGQETIVEIEINGEEFEVKGLNVLERNYLEVYVYEQWTDKELPVYTVNEEFRPTAIELFQGQTSPPNLLTEADLITLMEKHGIGTDATHAEHIETIKQRNYVGIENGKTFLPGELGMGLVEGYDSMGFQMSKPYLRAELERDLQQICEGRKSKEEVLSRQIESYKQVFVQAVAQDKKLYDSLMKYFGEGNTNYQPSYTGNQAETEGVRQCHQCGSEMFIRQKKNGTGMYISCSGYPGCKRALWLPDSVIAIRPITEQLCPNHSPEQHVRMVGMKLRRSGLHPVFQQDEEYVGCLECDPNLRDIMGLRYTGPMTASRNNDHRPQAAVTGTRQPPPPPPPPPPSIPRPSAPSDPMPRQPRRDFPRNMPDSEEDDEKMCKCGVAAVEFTVRKEGPNKGRKFYTCSTRQCSMFQWKDDNQGRGNPSPAVNANRRSSTSRGDVGDGDESVKCKCGVEAKCLTVMRETPNQGRQFYGCAQRNCDFFQWADESNSSRFPQPGRFPNQNETSNRGSWPPPAPQSRQRPSTSRGRGRGGQTSKPRKCGLCGEVGHTRNKCSYSNVT